MPAFHIYFSYNFSTFSNLYLRVFLKALKSWTYLMVLVIFISVTLSHDSLRLNRRNFVTFLSLTDVDNLPSFDSKANELDLSSSPLSVSPS